MELQIQQATSSGLLKKKPRARLQRGKKARPSGQQKKPRVRLQRGKQARKISQREKPRAGPKKMGCSGYGARRSGHEAAPIEAGATRALCTSHPQDPRDARRGLVRRGGSQAQRFLLSRCFFVCARIICSCPTFRAPLLFVRVCRSRSSSRSPTCSFSEEQKRAGSAAFRCSPGWRRRPRAPPKAACRKHTDGVERLLGVRRRPALGSPHPQEARLAFPEPRGKLCTSITSIYLHGLAQKVFTYKRRNRRQVVHAAGQDDEQVDVDVGRDGDAGEC